MSLSTLRVMHFAGIFREMGVCSHDYTFNVEFELREALAPSETRRLVSWLQQKRRARPAGVHALGRKPRRFQENYVPAEQACPW